MGIKVSRLQSTISPIDKTIKVEIKTLFFIAVVSSFTDFMLWSKLLGGEGFFIYSFSSNFVNYSDDFV